MKKIFACITALLLMGSAVFFLGSAGCVKEGVTVSGVAVGGMPYPAAAAAVREKLSSARVPFTLHTPFGDTMPAVSYTDNVWELLKKAKKNGVYEATLQREWVEAEREIAALCERAYTPPKDAALTFTRFGFSYTAEAEGVACDYVRSLAAALHALRAGEREASLVTRALQPAVTRASLEARTQKLAAFSTQFDASKTARAHNIALACERIAGSTLAPGESFSFNAAVGRRTAENGFLEAPVIVDGAYVQGTGGGVCQVSTTLMNAALRAGLTVTESRPHSLAVGYVPPSLDAMVSRWSDLKFCNPYPYPVYLAGRCAGGEITFEIYGKPDGRRYVPQSRVLARIPPPPPKVTEGEEDRTVRAEKEGIASESRLLVYDAAGRLVENRRLRKDAYAAVQGVYEKKRSEAAPREGENADTDGAAKKFPKI